MSTLELTWNDWLRQRGAVTTGRGVENFNQSSTAPEAEGPALVPLIHLSTIEVSGLNATAFLQTQLTNDVSTLDAGRYQPGALCDAKGRVLANFLLLGKTQSYTMILAADLAGDVCARLQKYILRMQVKVVVATRILLGLVGDAAPDVAMNVWGSVAHLSEGHVGAVDTSHLVRLSARRVLAMLDPQRAVNVWDTLTAQAQPSGRDAWDAQQIDEAWPLITRATQGRFLPQMLDLDRMGAISFSKGCYPGQEIVARARYLGEVKRRLWKGRAAVAAAPAEGEGIWADLNGTESGGTVINAAMLPDGHCVLLAVVNRPDAPNPTLAIPGPEGSRVLLTGQAAFGAT